jgi:hypothetical protein
LVGIGYASTEQGECKDRSGERFHGDFPGAKREVGGQFGRPVPMCNA